MEKKKEERVIEERKITQYIIIGKIDKYAITRLCRKCGKMDIIDEFFRKKDMQSFNLDDLPDEWIKRKCKNCSYVWNELPLDVGENNESKKENNHHVDKEAFMAAIRQLSTSSRKYIFDDRAYQRMMHKKTFCDSFKEDISLIRRTLKI